MQKKTKIIATLGPATSTREMILNLIEEGANAFRINFSHARHQDVKKHIEIIREINAQKTFPYKTGIIADLQGPKIRTGEMSPNTILKTGTTVTIKTDNPFEGNDRSFFVAYDTLAKDIQTGDRILINDGKIILVALDSDGQSTITATVIGGGALANKKGVNLPNTALSKPSLTEKDLRDVRFAVGQNVDWIALSFVRQRKDVEDLKTVIRDLGSEIPIISKIEKPEALDNIDQIIAVTDALMIARGDLGVEIPASQVPILQKELIHKARLAAKPVIVATHMLESMIEHISPTRAEVSDIANACLDGADAVMLSAETSVGKHPQRAVRQMNKVIESVEENDFYHHPKIKPSLQKDHRIITRLTCSKAAKTAESVQAKAIFVLTHSGYTALETAAYRPCAHILVFTDNSKIINRMSIVWGVYSFFYEGNTDTDRSIEEVNAMAKEMGAVKPKEYIINLSAMPITKKGFVNTLRISEVE